MTPNLREALSSAAPGERIRAYVVLAARPDLTALEREVAGVPRKERPRIVEGRLRAHDAAARNAILNYLDNAARSGEAEDVLNLFLVNTVAFHATPARIRELAMLAGVDYVALDAPAIVPTADSIPEQAPVSVPLDSNPPLDSNLEPPEPLVAGVVLPPHIVKIGAEQCWFAGQVGSGSVVSIIDKGIALNHPSIKNHLWKNPGEIPGNHIDDDMNGFVDDVNGWNFDVRDNNVDTSGGFDHGTKVAGLVVGDGSLVDATGTQYITGVAPDARVMSMVFGNYQTHYWACQQYSILKGADVILSSHSWKWDPASFPDYTIFRGLAHIEFVAGILHVNSTGNQGGDPMFPVPYNIPAPAGCPGPWQHPSQVDGSLSSTIGVGAVNLNDTLYTPSGVGPAAWEDVKITDPSYPHPQNPLYWDYPYKGGVKPGLLKPDVSAPTSVITTTLNNFYSFNFLGTSASAPQVAGMAALMFAANPHLEARHVAHLLQATALDLGPAGKDTQYGAGRIQCFEGVKRSMVSVKPVPNLVKLASAVSIDCRTFAMLPTYVVMGAAPGTLPIPNIGTLDITGPIVFLVENLASQTKDFTAASLTIPNAPVLVGIRFYVQLGVDATSTMAGQWILSAVDHFTIVGP